MQHAAQTLAAQNRFATLPKETEARPTLTSVATAAAAAFARSSWAAASTRVVADGNRTSVSAPRRRSFRSIAAVEPEPTASTPASAAAPATARRQWKATAKKVVGDDPAAAGGMFQGLASFGVRSAAHRSSSKVASAAQPSRWAAAARASRGQPVEGGRWWTAYRRMHGRFKVASAVPDSGDDTSDSGGSDGGHMAEIEEHALALLLRVPSRGELQMRHDAAQATAACDEGAGGAARASGRGGWVLLQQAPPAAPPAALAHGGVREPPVGPARGRWSLAAAAVGEGQEEGTYSVSDSAHACVRGESATHALAASSGDGAEAAAAHAATGDVGSRSRAAAWAGLAAGSADGADAPPSLLVPSAMQPWLGARTMLGRRSTDSGAEEGPVQPLSVPPVPGGSGAGIGAGAGAPDGDGGAPESDARPGRVKPLGSAWLRAKELTAPAAQETGAKVW